MTDKDQDNAKVDIDPRDLLPEPSSDEEVKNVKMTLEEVSDLLDNSARPEESEPNDAALSKEEKEVETLVKEEPLDVLEDPGLIMELGEDPVRLYLKEIGNIELLDTDQEFWLATCMEAARRVDSYKRQHMPAIGRN